MDDATTSITVSATTPFINSAQTDHDDDDNVFHSSSSLTFALSFSTFVAVCGSFTSGCAIGYTSPAESGITTDIGLSTSQYAVFCVIMTVGSVITQLISGKTSDYIGRKRTMWLAQLFFTLGWLAIIFAENVWWLWIGRLSIGFGVGFVSFAVPVYVAEIAPKNLRGALTAGYQMTLAFGIALTFITGSFVSWRILSGIGSVSGFIQITGLFCIPESPRWLAKVGRAEEVQEVLRKLRNKNVDVSLEAEDIQEYTKTCEAFEKFSQHGVLDLFQRKYAQAMIVGCGLMVIVQFGGSTAIVSYASYIFESAGFSTKVGSFGIAVIQIPAVICGVSLMDSWGRRPLMLLSLSGMCFSCFILCSSFLLKDFNLCEKITPALVFTGLLVYTVFISLGMGGIPFVIMAEIFPINMKGLAAPVLLLVNSMCSLITCYSFLFGFDWCASGVFFLFCVFCGGGLVFVVKMVPETKCRTLEEIQESMVHFK